MFLANFAEVGRLETSRRDEGIEREALAKGVHPDPVGAPELIQTLHEQNEERHLSLRTYLGPAYVHRFVLSLWGTGPGVLLSILMAATVFGAEFRWDFWKMLAIQRPKRSYIVIAKLVTFGILILCGLCVLLIAAYAFNELFLRLHGFEVTRDRLPIGEVLSWGGRAFLATFAYGAVAATFVLAFGSGLAGVGWTFGFLVGDWFLLRQGPSSTPYRFSYSPAQEVANLFAEIPKFARGIYGRVWPRQPQLVKYVTATFPEFHLEPVPPPLDGGIYLLSAVIALATLASCLIMRRREF